MFKPGVLAVLAVAGVVAPLVTIPVLAPVAALAQQPQPAAKLPDTPMGKLAGAFLVMLNNGSENAVTEFETAYGSAKRRAAVSTTDRVGRVGELKQRWGSFKVKTINSVSDSGAMLTVEVAGGGTIEMEFQVSEKEPGKLDAVMIASDGPAAKPLPVTPEALGKAINGAATALEENYVFPETGKKMAEMLRTKFKAGEYDSVADEAALAKRLTEDLQGISHDKHLRVRFAPTTSESTGPATHGPERGEMERENYGFRKAEILSGNVGYLRFDVFVDDDEAKKTAAAALAFLAYTDALVIDLRSNGGGSPEMIRFLTSYLFDEPTHLNDMIDRDGKVVEEYWTLKDIPGKRFRKDLPVYVLTSSRTFSGAEEFSYNLKNLKRATLIGETTGGGAHPVRGERLTERFMITVPFMRANNPITKTNWEGTGVTPDIETTADKALDRALEEARKATAGAKKK